MKARASKRRAEFVLIVVVVIFVIIGVLLALFLRVRQEHGPKAAPQATEQKAPATEQKAPDKPLPDNPPRPKESPK